MPPVEPPNELNSGWSRVGTWVLPITIIGAILVFVIPLPAALLDVLLAANITLAVLILLTTLAIRTPQEFSSFPTILLTTTLTRLVLNVATARRVLTHGGDMGLAAAGDVVRAFGEFVAGDEVVVGVILFAILVIIQFVVITKGATRISEVAARFMLDGLPGRQMAIDADLHAGLIDQTEAARRRDAVYRQADFFGAMDGAGKFVRGDAVAGVLITVINIIAGLYLGVFNHGMSVSEAVDVFTKLTIGDGLVSQVPAFLISLAAGLIVTRSSSDSDLGYEVTTQLFRRPEALGAASGFLVLLSFTALPKLPLLGLAGALGGGAFVLNGRKERPAITERPEPEPERSPIVAETPAADAMEELLQVDPLELEIGYRLIKLSDATRGGDLLERLRGVRQRVARELGLIVPPVRIRDEIGVGPHEYRLKIRGTVVDQGTAYEGRLLAVPPPGMVSHPEGRDGIDPFTGQPAVWIHAEGREVAELAGCRVLETSAVVAGQFGEVIMRHAEELLTHDQVRKLLDRARGASPALVDEVVPGLLRAGEIQRVLQGLVRERVSVRDLETILEALAEHAGKTRDTDELVEHVRRALGRQIVQQYRGTDGRLRVVAIPPALDERLAVADSGHERGGAVLGAADARGISRAVASALAPLIERNAPPVVVCSAQTRPVLKDLTHNDLPRLAVLSQREIPRDTPVEIVGEVVWTGQADATFASLITRT
jgi:flagellar biosynthesis protein FlhA